MKNFLKLIGFITIMAIIWFSMAGCGFISDDGSGGTGGGSTATKPTITIKNNTGYSLSGIWIKSSIATDWGSNLYGYSSLSDGQSRNLTLSQSLSSNNVYDIRLSQSSSLSGSGYKFIKYKVIVTDKMTVTFSTSDLNDESNLPTITIQNRSGVAFNSIYIKPSSSTDWGVNFGSVSNNSDKTVTIPVPPSNYTVFDIQTRSTNPTNTYTKQNITITNGMIITYTSADSDMTLIESPIIVIKNNTGYSLSGIWIKPLIATDWGSNLYGYSSLSDGQSRTFSLSQSLSTNSVYDIRLSQSSSLTGSGYVFIKYKITISNGMVITFSTSDLNNESNLPTITIQNRSGIALNSIYIKPSSSTDWGVNFGNVSNNSDKTVTIPVPPSNYTVFDIQMRSTNPTNTYTKRNITITNGMIITYTSADSDTPLMSLPIIVIQNNTGYSISGIWIKPSSSSDWGSNLYGYSSLSDGQSRTFSLSQSLSTNSVYDIRLSQSSSLTGSGYVFTKTNITISDGIIITLTSSNSQ